MFLSPFRLGWRRCLPVVALLAVAPWLQAPAHAQGTAGRTERADPLDPQARVPAATHQSPLAGYRRLGDDKPLPWREANDTVTRIGGWRAYAREAQQPEPAASAPAGRGAAPGHGGHKMH